MKTPYSFSVVRYLHDVVGGEFVNVGVVLYAPERNYIRAICTNKYGRLSKLFINVDGDQFRSLMNFMENRINDIRQMLETELQFDGKPQDVLDILHRVIPKDDSSLQFSSPGGGLTKSPDNTVEELFERYVERYTEKPHYTKRDDQDVWKVFKRPLEEKRIIKYLQPHTISTSDYDWEFEHAWKNEQWHLLKPISFDLLEARSIQEKAVDWLGKATELSSAPEPFKLHLLIGRPNRQELMPAYNKAENILKKNSVTKEFVREDEAEDFAEKIKTEIQHHDSDKA